MSERIERQGNRKKGQGEREGGRLLVWVAWFFPEGIEIQLGFFYFNLSLRKWYCKRVI